MTRLVWDTVGERFYETGVDRGVLYLPTAGAYTVGHAWNGLTAVTESPSGDSPDGSASSDGFLLPIRLSFSASCSTSYPQVTHRTSQRDLDWSGRDLWRVPSGSLTGFSLFLD